MNVLVFITALVLLIAAAYLLARSVPRQNVVFIVGSLMTAELALNAVRAGPILFGPELLFWPGMIIWTRVVSRWFLRRRRLNWNYGIWLIILAGAVAAVLQFAIVFSGVNWIAAARLAALRFAEASLCLLWLSPWFISKLPQQPEEHTQ